VDGSAPWGLSDDRPVKRQRPRGSGIWKPTAREAVMDGAGIRCGWNFRDDLRNHGRKPREAPEHIQHYTRGGDGGRSRMFAPVRIFRGSYNADLL
jgi:hypothetical protein